MALSCPKCGFETVEGANCPRCGVDVARYRAEMAVKAGVHPEQHGEPIRGQKGLVDFSAGSAVSGGGPHAGPSTERIGRLGPAALRTNGFAVASLVLGILWVLWIGSLLAVIFGHLALGQIKRARGLEAGRGMAIAGLTLGWIGLGFWILWFLGLLFAFLIPQLLSGRS